MEYGVFRAHGGCGIIPLGTADGSEQHCVRPGGQVRHLGLEGNPMLVDGRASYVAVGEVEPVPCQCLKFLKDPHRLAGDLGTDAISTQHGDLKFHATSP